MSLRGLLAWERREPQADVLMVTSSWPHESNPAYGIFIKRQLDSLAALGLRFDVLVLRGYLSFLAYPFAAARLLHLSLSRRQRYRVVHAHGGEAGVAAWFYRRAPLVVSYCGDDLLGTVRADGSLARGSVVKRAFLRQHARLARATITKSQSMAAVLPEAVQRSNAVIPSGVDPAEFDPVARDEARARLGWPVEEHVVLFAADPSLAVKRHWLAEEACRLAGQRLPSLRLHVAAQVPPAEMPLLMSAADCLLLTSASEGSPNTVKEALMCNLPVVATAVGDVESLLQDVTLSYICEPSPRDLASALLSCLERRARSNGREASEWLKAERIARRVFEVYRTAADRQPELRYESGSLKA